MVTVYLEGSTQRSLLEKHCDEVAHEKNVDFGDRFGRGAWLGDWRGGEGRNGTDAEAARGSETPAGSPICRGRARTQPAGSVPAGKAEGPAAGGRLDSRRGVDGRQQRRLPGRAFIAEGCAVASINYRLSQHAVFPAQIEDCKAAIRWLRANADEVPSRSRPHRRLGCIGRRPSGRPARHNGRREGVGGARRQSRSVEPRAVRSRLVRAHGVDDDGRGGRPARLAGRPADRRPGAGEQGESPQGQPADVRQ